MIKYRANYKLSSSGIKGVYPENYRKNKRWRAMIRIPGSNGKKKTFHIGYYSTPGEAETAYNDFMKKLQAKATENETRQN